MTFCCGLFLAAMTHAQSITGHTAVKIKKTYTIPHEGSPRAHKAAIYSRSCADPASTGAIRLALMAGKAVAALLPVTCGRPDTNHIIIMTNRVAQRKKKP